MNTIIVYVLMSYSSYGVQYSPAVVDLSSCKYMESVVKSMSATVRTECAEIRILVDRK